MSPNFIIYYKCYDVRGWGELVMAMGHPIVFKPAFVLSYQLSALHRVVPVTGGEEVDSSLTVN